MWTDLRLSGNLPPPRHTHMTPPTPRLNERDRPRALVVVFGHRNASSRHAHIRDREYSVAGLSLIAKERCARAVDVIRARGVGVYVLPTGSFGLHFNRSRRPHGALIANQIRQLLESDHEIDASVLLHSNSTNTVEDVFAVRKHAVDLGVSEIVLVSSDFHEARVEFLANRVLSDYRWSFVSAPTKDPRRGEYVMHESSALRQLGNTWADVPLYSGDGANEKVKLVHLGN